MSISYEGLWSLMEKNNVSQKDLSLRCGISLNVISRMIRGEYVALEVLDKVCNYFGCDYGDIISQKKTNTILPNMEESKILELWEQVRKALQEYMDKYNFKSSDISIKTKLSINTVKKFLLGEIISSSSYLKLLRLGEDFGVILDKHLHINDKKFVPLKDGNICEVETTPAKEVRSVSYEIYLNLLRLVPEGRLTRREDIEKFVAKKLGVEFVSFEVTNNILYKKHTELVDKIPYWRKVSKQGWLEDTLDCSRYMQEKKLKEEGFEITKCGPQLRSLRIVDYKKYLFDFEKESFVIFDEY